MATRIVQQVLYQDVADRLRAMIQSKVLAAGSWIDEARLTAELGISRTPLREALKVLVTEGLVRLEPRRGCYVNELSSRDLDEIFPLMAMLEGRCAYEAARTATDAQLLQLEPLHARLQQYASLEHIDRYYAVNAEIHEAIQMLAGNRWLSELIDNLRKVLSLSRHKSLVFPGRIHESCAEHIAIFAALKARDPDRAQALTRNHLLRQLEALHAMDVAEAVQTTVVADIQSITREPAHD